MPQTAHIAEALAPLIEAARGLPEDAEPELPVMVPTTAAACLRALAVMEGPHLMIVQPEGEWLLDHPLACMMAPEGPESCLVHAMLAGTDLAAQLPPGAGFWVHLQGSAEEGFQVGLEPAEPPPLPEQEEPSAAERLAVPPSAAKGLVVPGDPGWSG